MSRFARNFQNIGASTVHPLFKEEEIYLKYCQCIIHLYLPAISKMSVTVQPLFKEEEMYFKYCRCIIYLYFSTHIALDIFLAQW